MISALSRWPAWRTKVNMNHNVSKCNLWHVRGLTRTVWSESSMSDWRIHETLRYQQTTKWRPRSNYMDAKSLSSVFIGCKFRKLLLPVRPYSAYWFQDNMLAYLLFPQIYSEFHRQKGFSGRTEWCTILCLCYIIFLSSFYSNHRWTVYLVHSVIHAISDIWSLPVFAHILTGFIRLVCI